MANLSLVENLGHVKLCHTSNFELKMIRSFPSRAYFASQVTILVLNIILSLSTIFLNFVTIATFRSSIQLQKKACHFLIFVQSCNDFGIGLVVSLLFSIVTAGELVGDANCDLFFAFYISFFTTAGFSVVILSAMNLERYASIVHPVYHRNKVTKKKLLIYIFSICALFIFVSLASVRLGEAVLAKFVGYTFLLYFVSTIYLYTRIFLAGKAQLKRSEPRVNARQENVQIRRNDASMMQENRLGNRSDNQNNCADNLRQPSVNQDHSSNTQASLSNSQSELSGEQFDNQDRSSDSQNNTSHNREQEMDTSERLSSHTSDNQSNRSGNESECTEQNSGQQSSSNENSNPSNQTLSNKKSEQEFLMKFKLAKSCLIVVVCSFTSFVLPTVFQPLQLSELDQIFLDAWFTVLVLSNSTLDSLIFFWKNNMLRNEAKKILKKVFC